MTKVSLISTMYSRRIHSLSLGGFWVYSYEINIGNDHARESEKSTLVLWEKLTKYKGKMRPGTVVRNSEFLPELLYKSTTCYSRHMVTNFPDFSHHETT